jgi:isopenicillin-N N-acyltransferase-like protein
MLSIQCKGSPYEVFFYPCELLCNKADVWQIGVTHGKAAPEAISRCIGFYARLFQKKCKLSWVEVLEIAGQFEDGIKAKWPAYYEEMEG